MSSGANKEKTRFFETILSSPGMTEKCKISVVTSRQNILLLGRLIEAGLINGSVHFDDDFVSALPKESIEEFKMVLEELLRKAGLLDFYQKLKSI